MDERRDVWKFSKGVYRCGCCEHIPICVEIRDMFRCLRCGHVMNFYEENGELKNLRPDGSIIQHKPDPVYFLPYPELGVLYEYTGPRYWIFLPKLAACLKPAKRKAVKKCTKYTKTSVKGTNFIRRL